MNAGARGKPLRRLVDWRDDGTPQPGNGRALSRPEGGLALPAAVDCSRRTVVSDRRSPPDCRAQYPPRSAVPLAGGAESGCSSPPSFLSGLTRPVWTL